jgi:hypothetical protein
MLLCQQNLVLMNMLQSEKTKKKAFSSHNMSPHVSTCANSTSSAGSAGVGFAAGGTAFVEAWTSVNTRTATQNHLQLLGVWDMFGTNSRWPFPLQVP